MVILHCLEVMNLQDNFRVCTCARVHICIFWFPVMSCLDVKSVWVYVTVRFEEEERDGLSTPCFKFDLTLRDLTPHTHTGGDRHLPHLALHIPCARTTRRLSNIHRGYGV